MDYEFSFKYYFVPNLQIKKKIVLIQWKTVKTYKYYAKTIVKLGFGF